jgi:manganese transport protein
MLKRLKNLGPGLLVAAAFIGPGTVTTATVTGGSTGYALLWAVVVAIFATIVLQEMSARLGVVSREGLGEALRTTFENPVFKVLAVLLVVAAITVGNAAYEGGNITGAAIAVETVGGSADMWALVVGVLSFALLASGAYKLIERVLVALVIVMSIVFLVTAIMVRPDLGDIAAGIFVPDIPPGELLTVTALVGTTVVPYNLFLHASSVQEKWSENVPTGQALAESRTDTTLSIMVGGLITMAIVATAAAAFFRSGTEVTSAAQMAEQLEPVLGGSTAKYFFAVGLLAAGLTSAITAPLAAAYATSGALGWGRDLTSWKFRSVWAIILVVGTAYAYFGTNPVSLIVFAQVANGILLPAVAIFLLVVMNRSNLLGQYTNSPVTNTLGGLVVLLATGLGIYSILDVAGVLG